MPAQTSTASTEQVKPSAETPNPSGNLDGVEAQVTTERLLSALGNGVQGGDRPC
jgi:hypothetical protein